jgi:hypothetical protein
LQKNHSVVGASTIFTRKPSASRGNLRIQSTPLLKPQPNDEGVKEGAVKLGIILVPEITLGKGAMSGSVI